MQPTTTIIQCLQRHGQLMDTEIAAKTGIPLTTVRGSLGGLAERGEISHCSVTRFKNGKPVEGVLCRIAGYLPPIYNPRRQAVKKS